MQERQPREISALVAELSELARHAPARLGQRVAGLNVRDQAELALRLPPRLRLELLLHAPKPLRLVRSLPDSEFYLTVREVGPLEALPLVALGSTAQLQHLVDLESWRRDRFDADRSGAWVALLLEAGEPALRRFLRGAEDEQLALLFQRWIRVDPIEPEEAHDRHGHGLTEDGDDLGLVSPDGNYRFRPALREHGPAIRRMAQIFFLDDPERYRRIVWSALYELPAELEECALRWRQSRLEEHGFPPADEAAAVYAPPAGVRAPPRPLAPADPDGLAAPRSPLVLPGMQGRLSDALDRLDDETGERVLHELVSLANHVLVADGADTGEPRAHVEALEKVAGYIRIALETRDPIDAGRDAETLSRVPALELFREGHGQAVELQARARAMTRDGWAAGHERALDLLDPPLRERIDALLEPPAAGHGAPTPRRAFRSTAELDEARVALEIAEVMGRFFFGRLGLDLGHSLAGAAPDATEAPSFTTIFLTLLAWNSARGLVSVEPLPHDVLADFLRSVVSRRTADPDAPARSLEALVRRLREEHGLDPRQTALFEAFGRAGLERLAAECGALDPGNPVDPRFVTCLWVSPRR